MILVFGSVNLDTTYSLGRLPRPGESVLAEAVSIQPGGKGANQAVAAARDGAAVALVAAVGDDAQAEPALGELARAGVDLTRLQRLPGRTGSATICVDTAGQKQIVVARGVNARLDPAAVAEADLGPETTLLLQMEVDPAANAALIRRARARGTRIVLNLAPALPLAAEVLRAVDWLVVNAAEAAWLGEQLGAGSGAASLHAALGVGVVRTQGVQGAELAWGDGPPVFQPPVQVQARDATGAGDCLTGVFAAGLARGLPLPAALRRASLAAALSTTRLGAQAALPGAEEIDAALPNAPDPTDVQAEIDD